MNPDRRQRVEEIFEAALGLPVEERSAFVADASPDETLERQVTELLMAHERAEGVLERPAAPPVPSLPPGFRVGPYRIMGELGRGGMGVVYAAERDDGQFRRRVAIKVLRADADPALEARVVAERQILASLDHPNIARLLDGGVTGDGRPFLVMEHVDGLPIDVYADRMRLTLEERVRLFITVAEAVQYAHRNLVVHRDLKPSNILVTSRGDVKLLDFGIAKLLNPALAAGPTPLTLGEPRALTPEYASPEQIRGAPLSTATDVYSLGVVLYRLLAGRHPYTFDAQSMESIVEVVSRQAPARPSNALGTGWEPGELRQAAEDRRTTPERWVRRLQGDLDAIVLHALRKDPGDRYGSPQLLAHDLARHLEGLPVDARKGARGYRLRSFLRRHRYTLAAAAVVALSLLGGAGAALWQARVAERERERAEEALRESEEVADFLMSLFTVSDPADIRLEQVTAADLLRRGVLQVEALSAEPLVQARMLSVIADVHQQLGQYDQAIDLYRRALAVRMAELGAENVNVAAAMNDLGVALRNVAGGFDESRSLHQEALRIQRAVLPPGDPAIATTLSHLAYIEFDLARRAELQQEILEIRAAALGPDDRQTIDALMSLANTERGLGHYEAAEDLLRRALAAGRRSLGEEDAEAVIPMMHLGDVLFEHLGRADEAERLYREALAIQEAERGPSDLLLIHGLHSLGSLLGRQGRHDEAEATLRRAIDILTRALGPEHPRTVGSYLNLAAELSRQRRYAQADSIFRFVEEVWERTRGPRHPSVAVALTSHARTLEQMGRLDQAEADVTTALEIRAESLGERSIMVGLTLLQLGDIARRKGEMDRARRTYQDGRNVLLEHLAPDHPQVRDFDLRLEALDLAATRGPTTGGPITAPGG